jgi:hypothetical protein
MSGGRQSTHFLEVLWGPSAVDVNDRRGTFHFNGVFDGELDSASAEGFGESFDLRVPGIGTTHGLWESSHARAIRAGAGPYD